MICNKIADNKHVGSPNSSSLRPQDALILLKLISAEGRKWRQIDLAFELDLSQAEIGNALERLRRAGLVDESKKAVYRLAAIDFILHGLKYFYPAELGSFVRGVPTGHSASPLKGKLVVEDEAEWVWPDPEGKVRGIALYPLYESVPAAARRDPVLYELMALVDSIRAGSARERKLAEDELRKRLLKSERKNETRT